MSFNFHEPGHRVYVAFRAVKPHAHYVVKRGLTVGNGWTDKEGTLYIGVKLDGGPIPFSFPPSQVWRLWTDAQADVLARNETLATSLEQQAQFVRAKMIGAENETK